MREGKWGAHESARIFRKGWLILWLTVLPFLLPGTAKAQTLTFVELNCENLFDCRHDSLKQDQEFLPDGAHHWTKKRYWTKQNNIAREILSCADELPDLVALIEVENDSVVRDLTRRSLLRNAGYHYLMTESPDVRGLDVALLYQPASLRPLCFESISSSYVCIVLVFDSVCICDSFCICSTVSQSEKC